MWELFRPRHCSSPMPGISSDQLSRSLVYSSSFARDSTEVTYIIFKSVRLSLTTIRLPLLQVLPASEFRIPKRSALALQIPTGFAHVHVPNIFSISVMVLLHLSSVRDSWVGHRIW
ncbi:hypothetical protein SAY86_000935 [Trapa natans]|uniref:Uncharacterized protein n=1 Tax=Trapa natans TaxID=22666 RepID=A0AAN7MPY5_TRANT|nr:hypothetical protein SAY86_000935 [Trapa natans]